MRNRTNWNGATYQYDAFNQMTTMASGTEYWAYLYTADDERIWSYDLMRGLSHWTIRDLGAKVLRDYLNNAGSWSVATDYLYRDGLLLAAETQTGQRHFHLDHLGTPRLITRAGGEKVAYHLYYPFGEEATAYNQDTERMKFTGHERDLASPAGAGDDLDYMHARHESPVTGRFLSVDTSLSQRRVPRSPQRWNRYAYSVGNPQKLIDPDGKEAIAFIVGPSRAEDAKGIFGHAAFYATSSKGKAGVSYGGARGFERGVRDFIAFYTGEGRQVKMYVLKTSPEQDQKMVEFLKKHPDGNVDPNALGASLMLTQNCTTAVCNTLQAGGVLKEGETANGAMTFLSDPKELQESLETGELSDDVKAVVIFDPEADKKVQKTSSDLQGASCFYTGVCGVAPPPP